MVTHRVRQGDTVIRLAVTYDRTTDTIWQANPALAKKRDDPNVLLDGDEVEIPDAKDKSEPAATAKHHKFVLTPQMALYRLQVFRYEKPFAKRKYVLEVDREIVSAPNVDTGDNGLVEAPIPADAVNAKLTFPDDELEFDLRLGHLDPRDEDSGWRQRLELLGYACGSESEGELSLATRRALARFQFRFKQEHKLEVTGEADRETLKALDTFFAKVKRYPAMPKPDPKTPRPKPIDPGSGSTSTGPHTRAKIKDVTFRKNHPVGIDGYGLFATPHWQAAARDPGGPQRGRQSPVCYSRRDKVEIEATFAIEQQPVKSETLTFVGMCTDPSLEFRGEAQVDPGMTVVTVRAVASKALADKVACHEKLRIEWTGNAPGEGPKRAGLSEHVLYVVLANPKAEVHWTLLDISCRAASGASDEASLVTKAYAAFHGRKLVRKRDDKVLTYWFPHGQADAINTQDLMFIHHGSGTCEAWSHFFLDMLNLHGVTSAKRLLVAHPCIPEPAELLTTKRQFYPKAFEVGTRSGQGHDNADGVQFNNHFMVMHEGKIYDPSYGSGPFASKAEWLAASVVRMIKDDPEDPHGSNKLDDADSTPQDLRFFRIEGGKLESV